MVPFNVTLLYQIKCYGINVQTLYHIAMSVQLYHNALHSTPPLCLTKRYGITVTGSYDVTATCNVTSRYQIKRYTITVYTP